MKRFNDTRQARFVLTVNLNSAFSRTESKAEMTAKFCANQITETTQVETITPSIYNPSEAQLSSRKKPYLRSSQRFLSPNTIT